VKWNGSLGVFFCISSSVLLFNDFLFSHICDFFGVVLHLFFQLTYRVQVLFEFF
jgi:hypothetical protein